MLCPCGTAAPAGTPGTRHLLSRGLPEGPGPPSSHVWSFTEGTITMAEKTKRGFAGMSAEKQREIASKGGKAAHAKGTAHHFTPEEARVAGRKGGQAAHAKGTAHEFTPEEARAAGRKGGQSSHAQNQGLPNRAEDVNLQPTGQMPVHQPQMPPPMPQATFPE